MRFYRFCVFTVLQNKRLLSKISFLLVLLMIPVFAFGMKFFFREESGVYRVVLCGQPGDTVAESVIDRLESSQTILRFSTCTSEQEAEAIVQSGESDAAWIFLPDLENRIREYCAKTGRRKPFIRVLQREESSTSRMSREKLYGAVFPEVSYVIFENLVREYFPEEAYEKSEIEAIYSAATETQEILEYEYLEGESPGDDMSYLLSPVRGLMAMMTVVCGMAAQMIFLSDKKRGIYDWQNERKQLFSGMAMTVSAVFDGAVAVLLSVLLTGTSRGIGNELLSAGCLIVVSSAFCILCGCLISSPKALGICLPFLSLLLLFVSPVFFALYQLQSIQRLFPLYYYLNTLYGTRYLLLGCLYAAAVLLIACIADRLKRRLKRR